jgi:hypothetical protein
MRAKSVHLVLAPVPLSIDLARHGMCMTAAVSPAGCSPSSGLLGYRTGLNVLWDIMFVGGLDNYLFVDEAFCFGHNGFGEGDQNFSRAIKFVGPQ